MNNYLLISTHGQPYRDELEYAAENCDCIADLPLNVQQNLIKFKKMNDIEFDNEKELLEMIDSDLQDAWYELHPIDNIYDELGLTENDFIYP